MIFTIIRGVFLVAIIALLFISQRFWYRQASRVAQKIRTSALRTTLRLVQITLLLVAFGVVGFWMISTQRTSFALLLFAMPLFGLWLMASLSSYVAIMAVKTVGRIWTRFRHVTVPVAEPAEKPTEPAATALPDPSRRHFFQTAGYFAGAVPFVGGVYGFLIGRQRFTLERVEVPIAGLPEALDGLRIAQLSDFHTGAYFPREQVRRAVEMANELDADLGVVTGDFITSARDPLGACVEEIAQLRAPLGVWGCLGNHEIYADCEDEATRLLGDVGVRVLRTESVPVLFRGAPLNLIGVDHQRNVVGSAGQPDMLPGVEPIVRRDAFNILLSHNPNAFYRAAALGIELTLAGHTHGGQVQVEILEHHLNPALFLSEFTAGLYRRPVSSVQPQVETSSLSTNHSPLATSPIPSPVSSALPRIAHLYVNRGLGTIGAPIRLNSPPEITLLTLRCA